jgi:hypothetical protein
MGISASNGCLIIISFFSLTFQIIILIGFPTHQSFATYSEDYSLLARDAIKHEAQQQLHHHLLVGSF